MPTGSCRVRELFSLRLIEKVRDVKEKELLYPLFLLIVSPHCSFSCDCGKGTENAPCSVLTFGRERTVERGKNIF